VRRERLRREAEEARARIAGGQSVRLSHVVELPQWQADGSDSLAAARRMSPAVGEAAKKFAPDAPVSRLLRADGTNGAPAEGEWEHETDPSFRLADSTATDPGRPMPVVPPAAEAPDAAAVLAALSSEDVPAVTEPPTPPPAIAPVAPPTPPPVKARSVEEEFEAEIRAALGTVKPRRWPWIAAASAAALALVWVLRPQPATDKKDAPWLAAEQAKVERSVEAPPGARPAETAPKAVEAAPVQPAKVEPAPSVADASVIAPAPESDGYAKALEEGEKLLKRGRYRQAVSEFKRAVKLNPESVPALLALGDAYLEADAPRNAVKPLETAARLDPRGGRAQLLLGTAYQSLGKNAEAVKAYQRYLEVEPSGEFARDVRSILANLQH
jgi:Flp pilus assembly protein TadD